MIRALVILALSACGGAQTKQPAIALPYEVPAEVGTLVVDDAAFAKFAATVRPDVEKEARSKDPEIAKARIFVLALFDAIDGNWPQAVALVDKVAALEAAPEQKAMTGLTIRVWGDADGDATKFRAALDARAAALPRAKLEGELAMLRTMGQVFTPDVCRQLTNEEVNPHVKDGRIGIEQVHAIVFQRYAVVRLVPVGKEIDASLGALGVNALTPAEPAPPAEAAAPEDDQ